MAEGVEFFVSLCKSFVISKQQSSELRVVSPNGVPLSMNRLNRGLRRAKDMALRKILPAREKKKSWTTEAKASEFPTNGVSIRGFRI